MLRNDTKRRQLLFGAAAFLWMITIFCFSARPADLSDMDSGLFTQLAVRILYPGYREWDMARQAALFSAADRVIRKSAHFSEYFLLCILWYKAFCPSVKRALLSSAGLTVLYAAADELHQYFVPGRAAKLTDVLIDSAGALLAVLVVLACRKAKARVSSGRE